MDNELMNLALLSSPNEMLEAARYVSPFTVSFEAIFIILD